MTTFADILWVHQAITHLMRRQGVISPSSQEAISYFSGSLFFLPRPGVQDMTRPGVHSIKLLFTSVFNKYGYCFQPLYTCKSFIELTPDPGVSLQHTQTHTHNNIPKIETAIVFTVFGFTCVVVTSTQDEIACFRIS